MGIDACSKDAEFYAIHDGARPLVTVGEIENCIANAIEFGASALGVPTKDTIKICNSEGFIVSTPERSALMAIQTPQIFSSQLYRDAMNRARATGNVYTDDCQLIENFGHKVHVSKGSYRNIKITTPEDVAIADAILNFDDNEGIYI